MSIASRIVALSVSVTATFAMSTGAARAADFDGQPSIAREHRGALWRTRHLRSVYPRDARGELIAGVRGASPLTVPFFGYGWYPGPTYYYGPRLCCRPAGGAVISVMY